MSYLRIAPKGLRKANTVRGSLNYRVAPELVRHVYRLFINLDFDGDTYKEFAALTHHYHASKNSMPYEQWWESLSQAACAVFTKLINNGNPDGEFRVFGFAFPCATDIEPDGASHLVVLLVASDPTLDNSENDDKRFPDTSLKIGDGDLFHSEYITLGDADDASGITQDQIVHALWKCTQQYGFAWLDVQSWGGIDGAPVANVFAHFLVDEAASL